MYKKIRPLLVCFLSTWFAFNLNGADLEDIYFDTSGDTAVVVYCENTASGALEIPAIYQGKAVTSIGGQAFHSCVNLTSVVIPSSVRSIGGNAFYNCSGLTSVTITDGVLDISSGAFALCTKLTSIGFPDSVIEIGPEVLGGCSSLTNISVGAGNTGFSAPGGVLHDKSQKTILKYPEGKQGAYTMLSTVANAAEHSFIFATGLSGITLSDKLGSISDYAFGHSGLTSVVLPDSVTNISGNAFLAASSLTTVRFGGRLAFIGDLAFEGCSELIALHFEGDAPTLGLDPFAGVSQDAKVYVTASATSFHATFGGLPVVLAVNKTPVAVNDTASTNEDTPVVVSVLANDSDGDGDTLSVTAGTANNGTVVVNASQTITYTPNNNFNGIDT
ncbi:MAG: hypothetical protein ACI9OD_004391, partial [Limisphaerales bacterium]